MKLRKRLMSAGVVAIGLVFVPAGQSQSQPQGTQKALNTGQDDAQKKNVQAYIELMRRNVRQDKAEIMGSVMALNAQDAAKFWPIYSDYDTQLAKLNDQRVQNITEYTQSYNDMTDEKADGLIHKAMEFQKQRAELFAATYEKLKQALGATTAARFAQVEHQLLLIIDLQIDAALPVVGQSS